MAEQNIKEEFMRVSHRMRKLQIGQILGGISQGEFFALELIRKGQERSPDQKGIIVSQLAKMQRISAPATSRMLRNLEERDLIRREIDKGDRRNTYVYLTEKGMEEHKQAFAAMDKFSDRIMDRMGYDNAKMLISLIEKMTSIMEDELSKTEKGDKNEKPI